MSVDLIHGPSPAADLDPSSDDVRIVDTPPHLTALPLPQVVGTARPADPVEALLLSVAHGDQGALVALQARMAGLVHLNIRRILRDASQAEAVTHETFTDLLTDAARFDPDQGDAQTWLLTRAHQHASDHLPTPHNTTHQPHPTTTSTPPQPVAT